MKKLVLADYFLGFSTREVSGSARPWRLYYESGEEAGLKPPRCNAAFSGDLYINGDIKDIASTYYPAIGPYDVADPHVAEYHVLLAKSAGIDGFMAEFTMGQEAKLLSLVNAAKKYDFQIGINWITQSHLAENQWLDRAAAIAKAHEVVRWMVEHVYKPCGVRYRDRYLLLAFLAHPREATHPFDPFFSPTEIRQLKQTAIDASCDMDIFVLPWETLPDRPGNSDRVWDGYFPWVWSSSGSAIAEDAGWSRVTTREQYIQRLREYYEMCRRVKQEGRIGGFIGAVLPGFDDHKGQAWGEGLKRYLPREGGQTLRDTWSELRATDVDAVLIITWNDWVESSQIEPSLELGESDLLQTARQIGEWKNAQADERRLALPMQILEGRRILQRYGDGTERADDVRGLLDTAASAVAKEGLENAEQSLAAATSRLNELERSCIARSVHLFWEFGFDSAGIGVAADQLLHRVVVDTHAGLSLGSGVERIGFAIDETIRRELRCGCLVARLSIEYLDIGTDFLRVLVDAADSAHEEIASFKKTDTGRWQNVSFDLLNARFAGGRENGANLQLAQRAGTRGGVRSLRIDGVLYPHSKSYS